MLQIATPSLQGNYPRYLWFRTKKSMTTARGLAYMYGYMPEIIIYTRDYLPQNDCLFEREVIATKELLF